VPPPPFQQSIITKSEVQLLRSADEEQLEKHHSSCHSKHATVFVNNAIVSREEIICAGIANQHPYQELIPEESDGTQR